MVEELSAHPIYSIASLCVEGAVRRDTKLIAHWTDQGFNEHEPTIPFLKNPLE